MAYQIKFLRSSRGGQLLVINNYCFKIDRKVNNKIYYKCRQCSDGCPARVILNNENLTITEKNHSHESDIQYIIKLETKNETKEEISHNPSQPIKQTYNEVISSKRQKLMENFNSTEVALSLPTFNQISSNSYKKRSEFIPTEPSTRSQLILNNEWTTTVCGQNFLIINSGGGLIKY
jgi:putative cell wall-binding protein